MERQARDEASGAVLRSGPDQTRREARPTVASHDHPHTHGHGDGSPDATGYGHEDHSELSEIQLRVRALETILTEKGYIEPLAIDQIVQAYETKVGPHNGARIVARAWTDPAYRQRLLDDANSAVAEVVDVNTLESDLVVVANGDDVHNMIVCTLCSCYPWEVLGLPPTWYKSAPYRSRAVIEPRTVLEELGVSLPDQKQVRVWDSTAYRRYFVLPERPAGTDGWSAEQLEALVTRDSLIGAGLARTPAEVDA
jgi:nitrile hydratase subunit alpha